jgi:hypothetical protein
MGGACGTCIKNVTINIKASWPVNAFERRKLAREIQRELNAAAKGA